MRFAADENFSGNILDGLLVRLPNLDIVRVQDTSMYQAPDPDLLEWLANEERVLLTHDVKTMPKYVYERVQVDLSVPGIIEVKQDPPIGMAIDILEVILGAGRPDDFANQVRFIPF